MSFVTWRTAMQQALYGPSGFYRQAPGPAGHFRTSVSASSTFAQAIWELVLQTDRLLGHPHPFQVIDMAAGQGQLAAGLLTLARQSPLAGRIQVQAVEIAPRPVGLDPEITWLPQPPTAMTGLIIANEWLDNVACDVVQTTGLPEPEHLAVVEVNPQGQERLGGPASPEDAAWVARWWPLESAARAQAGLRAEVGRSRDQQWSWLVGHLQRGIAVAIDYATTTEARASGLYPTGTLTAYRAGRQVRPVPDGSCDLTAAVALDACAAAIPQACTALVAQHEALGHLGVSTQAAAGADLLQRLLTRSQSSELLDPDGLGGFTWLMQAVRCDLPRWAAVTATPQP